MTSIRKHFRLITLALTAVGLHAQGTVYVSLSGNDSNICTITTAPCRTFEGAIPKVASGGTVLALDSGDFGTATINKPLILDGGPKGAFMAISQTSTLAIVVGLNASQNGPVVIRNVTITMQQASSQNTGVSADLSGGSIVFEHVSVINGGSSLGSTGIAVVTNNPGIPVRFKDVTILGVDTGISVANNAASPTLATFENVSVSAADIGIHALEASITVRNSSVVNFTGGITGIFLAASSTSPVSLIENTQIANQGIGIHLVKGIARLSNCVITGNTTGVDSISGSYISYRNNTFAGNGSDGAISLSTSLK